MSFQLRLYQSHTSDLATDQLINDALAAQPTVAIGVSGGKDSTAVAVRTIEYLNETGHRGKRLLIWADLGRLEWQASGTVCSVLAHYALELSRHALLFGRTQDSCDLPGTGTRFSSIDHSFREWDPP